MMCNSSLTHRQRAVIFCRGLFLAFSLTVCCCLDARPGSISTTSAR